ncbi:hypothetical protein ONZ43_g5912 [Nemania bipapillata]|uniref:Uncharacterized protein n=1 Tax=Nemania bipapillata TaxID=110536 RepID=A0ACC2I614_9PEZI|nr:hypothetical protein ONZ43_g5912 [Nemania bipapillata]
MYDEETYQMYTMNEDAFTRFKAKELEQLRRARALYRLKAVALIEWGYEIKPLEEMSDDERSKEHRMLTQHLPKIGSDPFDTEIEVAAFVRGYYRTAATRFVENVTMNVNSVMFWKLLPFVNYLEMTRGPQLDSFMNERLDIFGSTTVKVYENLMEEDEKIAELRRRLKGEKDKLSQAMASINGLECSSPGGSGSETILATPVIDLDEAMDDI